MWSNHGKKPRGQLRIMKCCVIGVFLFGAVTRAASAAPVVPAPTTCEALPDMKTVPSDLTLPPLTPLSSTARVSPGQRSIVRLPGEWASRHAYIVLYIPPKQQPSSEASMGNSTSPLILDLPGNGNYHNQYGDMCTGRPENVSLGYGLTGGSPNQTRFE